MRESDYTNYYSMLGLTSRATQSEIEEAYTKLRLKYLYLLETEIGLVGEKQKAEVDLELLQLAYEALVDARRRAHYDMLLPDDLKSWDERVKKETNVCNWWGSPGFATFAKNGGELGEAKEPRRAAPRINSDPMIQSAFSKAKPPTPVSQLIKRRRNILYRLKCLLFGD